MIGHLSPSFMTSLVIGGANPGCPWLDEATQPLSPNSPLFADAEPPFATGAFVRREGGGEGGGVRGSWAIRTGKMVEMESDEILLPLSVTALTPANTAFLRGTLENLRSPGSVIEGLENEVCQRAFEQALSGEISTLDAAASLVKAHEKNAVERMLSGEFYDADAPRKRVNDLVKRVDRYPLGEAGRRFEEGPEVIARLLKAHPAYADLEITEFELNYDDNHTLGVRASRQTGRITFTSPNHLTVLFFLERLGALYDLIHPKGSRIWRSFPLQLLVGAVHTLSGGNGIDIQFTVAPSSFDHLREHVVRREWPVCVPTARSEEEDFYFDIDLFRLHQDSYDGFKSVNHDFYHVLKMNQPFQPGLSLEEKWDDMVLVDGAFTKAVRADPEDIFDRSTVHAIRDELLSGDVHGGRIVRWVHGFLETHHRGWPSALTAGQRARLKEDFLRHLRNDLEGHPRRKLILGSWDC